MDSDDDFPAAESNDPKKEDIYDDVCDYDLGDTIAAQEAKIRNLEERISEFAKDNEKLVEAIVTQKKIEENLEKNISSLFLTAKTEIERKDHRIAELNQQLEDLLLKRNGKRRAMDTSTFRAAKIPKYDDSVNSDQPVCDRKCQGGKESEKGENAMKENIENRYNYLENGNDRPQSVEHNQGDVDIHVHGSRYSSYGEYADNSERYDNDRHPNRLYDDNSRPNSQNEDYPVSHDGYRRSVHQKESYRTHKKNLASRHDSRDRRTRAIDSEYDDRRHDVKGTNYRELGARIERDLGRRHRGRSYDRNERYSGIMELKDQTYRRHREWDRRDRRKDVHHEAGDVGGKQSDEKSQTRKRNGEIEHSHKEHKSNREIDGNRRSRSVDVRNRHHVDPTKEQRAIGKVDNDKHRDRRKKSNGDVDPVKVENNFDDANNTANSRLQAEIRKPDAEEVSSKLRSKSKQIKTMTYREYCESKTANSTKTIPENTLRPKKKKLRLLEKVESELLRKQSFNDSVSTEDTTLFENLPESWGTMELLAFDWKVVDEDSKDSELTEGSNNGKKPVTRLATPPKDIDDSCMADLQKVNQKPKGDASKASSSTTCDRDETTAPKSETPKVIKLELSTEDSQKEVIKELATKVREVKDVLKTVENMGSETETKGSKGRTRSQKSPNMQERKKTKQKKNNDEAVVGSDDGELKVTTSGNNVVKVHTEMNEEIKLHSESDTNKVSKSSLTKSIAKSKIRTKTVESKRDSNTEQPTGTKTDCSTPRNLFLKNYKIPKAVKPQPAHATTKETLNVEVIEQASKTEPAVLGSGEKDNPPKVVLEPNSDKPKRGEVKSANSFIKNVLFECSDISDTTADDGLAEIDDELEDGEIIDDKVMTYDTMGTLLRQSIGFDGGESKDKGRKLTKRPSSPSRIVILSDVKLMKGCAGSEGESADFASTAKDGGDKKMKLRSRAAKMAKLSEDEFEKEKEVSPKKKDVSEVVGGNDELANNSHKNVVKVTEEALIRKRTLLQLKSEDSISKTVVITGQLTDTVDHKDVPVDVDGNGEPRKARTRPKSGASSSVEVAAESLEGIRFCCEKAAIERDTGKKNTILQAPFNSLRTRDKFHSDTALGEPKKGDKSSDGAVSQPGTGHVSNNATILSNVADMPKQTTKRRITPIRVGSPTRRSENVTAKSLFSDSIQVTAEGDIPLLHITETNFGSLSSDELFKNADKNILRLLDNVSISHLENSTAKFGVEENAENLNDSVQDLTFKNIMEKVSSTPVAIKTSVPSGVGDGGGHPVSEQVSQNLFSVAKVSDEKTPSEEASSGVQTNSESCDNRIQGGMVVNNLAKNGASSQVMRRRRRCRMVVI